MSAVGTSFDTGRNWPNLTRHHEGISQKDLIYEITTEEIKAGLTYRDIVRPRYPELNILRYGADRRGVDYGANDNAFETAVLVSAVDMQLDIGFEAGIDGRAWGPQIVVPAGLYNISKMIDVPNRVGFRGEGSRVTVIRAHSAWGSDTTMIRCLDGDGLAGTGTIASFNQIFYGLTLQGEEQATITKVIETHAWQEQSGLSDVHIVVGAGQTGLSIESGVGGSALLGKIEDVAIGGRSGVDGVAGIDINSPTDIVVNIKNSVFGTLTDGIRVRNSAKLFLTSCHFENCVDGVQVDTGILDASTCRGHNTTTNLFHFTSNNGRGTLRNITSSGVDFVVLDPFNNRSIGDSNLTNYNFPTLIGVGDSATPSLGGDSRLFSLNGTTTITGFTGTYNGQDGWIRLAAGRTIDFSQSGIRGNNGVSAAFNANDFGYFLVENGVVHLIMAEG